MFDVKIDGNYQNKTKKKKKNTVEDSVAAVLMGAETFQNLKNMKTLVGGRSHVDRKNANW